MSVGFVDPVDFGTDIPLVSDLAPIWGIVSGEDNLAMALLRRSMTPSGALAVIDQATAAPAAPPAPTSAQLVAIVGPKGDPGPAGPPGSGSAIATLTLDLGPFDGSDRAVSSGAEEVVFQRKVRFGDLSGALTV